MYFFIFMKAKDEKDEEKLDKDGKVVRATDEEESGETTSSCEESNGADHDTSDTASAPSPANKNFDDGEISLIFNSA